VEVLPGPSAVITALVASGLPAASWRFAGFLPRRRAELETLLARTPETLVAFESPRRLGATLDLLAALDPQRPAAVCRELTKVHEEVRRGSAAQLAAHYREGVLRGEVVLVLGGAPAEAGRTEDALEALRELVAAGARTRAAAGVVARLTGTRANDLYRELTAGQ
jgi:16S rRNA (cytidine1402-2'-O)-methyltransferase